MDECNNEQMDGQTNECWDIWTNELRVVSLSYSEGRLAKNNLNVWSCFLSNQSSKVNLTQ